MLQAEKSSAVRLIDDLGKWDKKRLTLKLGIQQWIFFLQGYPGSKEGYYTGDII